MRDIIKTVTRAALVAMSGSDVGRAADQRSNRTVVLVHGAFAGIVKLEWCDRRIGEEPDNRPAHRRRPRSEQSDINLNPGDWI